MPVNAVQLIRAATGGEQTSDGDLLGRFIDRRDEAAFVLLVRRHAPMVWGVCRRVLPHNPDAEDAFQATFLVLVQKARAVPREAVGNWLYGVARRASLLARRTISRRRERVGEMIEVPAPEPLDELRAELDEELSRLPDMYRSVIVLCDLEGRTRREASAELGWPEGTVAGRLVRAREMLAKRLARHAPSVSLVAVLAGTASARVPEVFAATATIPSGVATLTHELLSAMARGKLMKTATVLLLLGCAGFGVALHAGQKPDPDQPPTPVVTKAPVIPEKADDVIWGKEVDGLQAGLVAATRVYRPGETVKMEVRLRNVGKADVTIKYGNPLEDPPHFTDADGVRLTVAVPPRLGIIVIPQEHVLKPGETMSFFKPEVRVESKDKALTDGLLRVVAPTIFVGPGKYRFAFEGMVHSHPKLSTGTLEFEVKDAVIAWGKEVGGLQAGIVVPPDAGVQPFGSKLRREVKLRNVSKAEITITHNILQEHAPSITDAGGKQVRVSQPPPRDGYVPPTKRVVKPDETVTLHTLEVAVEAEELGKVIGPETRVDVPTIKVRPGKYMIGYGGMLQSHPTLATESVEFQVGDAKPAAPETFTEWGKEINGLQAGLGFPVGQKRAYALGDTVTLVVRVRNVGKQEVKFQYVPAFFQEKPPTVTDGDGKPVALWGIAVSGRKHPSEDVTLAPGKEIELYQWKRALRPADWIGTDGVPSLYGTGKFRVQYGQVIGNSTASAIEIDPALSKLATGTLELDVQDKRGIIAWGKEAGGLQAGLEVKEKRTYRHGETVTLLVRVRNVSKETVKFAYIRQYLDENPPGVTGADGKVIPQATTGVTGLIHAPLDVSLEPGKEVVLGTRIHGTSGVPYELRPVGGESKATTQNHPLKVGTGKVALGYEKVFGGTSIGALKIDPKIADLGTGKLELEVTVAGVRLPEPEPDVQEAADALHLVMGPLQKDGARVLKTRKEVVGKPIRVEGIAWGQPSGRKRQEGTVSPQAGGHVVYEGGSVFVRGIDFTETKARGKPVRVTGTLRFESKIETRWGDVMGYYYIEATKFEVIDAVADPHLVYLEK